MLASTSPQSLCPPSRHANMLRIFPGCRRPCWRRPLRKAFFFRWGTPTCSGFSRAAGIHVGADFPARPFSSVEARQHAQDFPGLLASMLAPTSPQGLCLPSGHANMLRIFPTCRHLCWRQPPRKPFVLRRDTPTRPGFSRLAGSGVGVDLPAKPLSSVGSRQYDSDYLDLPVPKNERACIRKAISA